MHNISWSKNFWGNEQTITENGKYIGTLKKDTLGKYTNAKLYSEEYLFETKGAFSQQIKIFDTKNQKHLGEVKFNTWRTRAFINIENKQYEWKYTNTWSTKWELRGADKTNIQFKSSMSGGNLITQNEVDPLLILLGLKIKTYYEQFIWVAFIPIWIVIFTNS